MESEQKFPLKGVKIADFTWYQVGPQGIRYLAVHGATVVLVETHTRPQGLRASSPYKDNIPSLDGSGAFANCNASKYGISLDLNKPRGQEVARRLIAWSDIVVEAYTPDIMKRWGLDYESVKKINPEIIYLSTSQQGQFGPSAKFKGFGNLASALAGFSRVSGWPDREPSPPYGAYSDAIGTRFVAIALLSALDYRRRTGKGLYLDLSQLEATIHFLAPLIMDYSVNDRIAQRKGNRLDRAAPHGVYPCRGDDRWIAIAVFNDSEWQALCRTLGDPPWCQDTRFANFLARKQNEEELDRLVTELTSSLDAEWLEKALQAAGMAAHVVETARDLFEDAQIKHRGYFHWLNHTKIGPHAYDGTAFQLSRSQNNYFAAPCLGEHNEYVFKELLGMSDDEVGDLLAERVITTDADLPSALQK